MNDETFIGQLMLDHYNGKYTLREALTEAYEKGWGDCWRRVTASRRRPGRARWSAPGRWPGGSTTGRAAKRS